MLEAIILGVIQGTTEFLPISSSGHLLLFHWLSGTLPNSLKLDATLHLATALALLIYFYHDWIKILCHWKTDPLLKYLLVGTLPAAVAGFLGEDFVSATLRSPWVVVTMLIIIGLLMLYSEHSWNYVGNPRPLGFKQALTIGLAQTLALIPGTSRSGITIIAGMSQKLSRAEAARFAFLLGTPITLGAGIMELPKLYHASINNPALNLSHIGLAFLVTFGVSLITIHNLLKFLKNHSLKVFALYRFALALVTTWWLIR